MIPVLAFLVIAPASVAQEAESNPSLTEAAYEYANARSSGSKSRTRDTAKTVVEIAQQTLPSWDVRLPVMLDNYGVALMDTGDVASARDVLKDALSGSKDIHGIDAKESIPILMHYADSLAEFGNSRSQEKYYKQALKIGDKLYGKESNEYADILMTAGYRILDLSRTTSGVKYLKNARDIFVEKQGELSHAAASTSFYLGKSDLARSRYKSAIEHFLNALPGFASVGESDLESELITRAYLIQAYESLDMSDAATEHCLVIGEKRMITPNQNLQPLFRVAPEYPSQLYRSREEGHVDLEFTVDESGFVRNAVATDRQGDPDFEKSAIKAVNKFRFAPAYRNGEPVAVDKVQTRFLFKL